MKKILGRMRRAISDYNMIQDGDKIGVGLSGGKDSITLLLGLNKLKSFFPEKFDIIAICLDMGFNGFDTTPLKEMCRKNDIEFVKEETNISNIVFEIRNEKNPCSLCANLRRGALHNTAIKYGCNKVALGHHLDDVIETFFLSLLYEGRINTFSPITYLSRKNIHVLRPLVYIPETDIKCFSNTNNIPIVKNPCPVDCKTCRQKIKDLLKTLYA